MRCLGRPLLLGTLIAAASLQLCSAVNASWPTDGEAAANAAGCGDGRFSELYAGIDEDLKHWAQQGIDARLMDRTLNDYTSTTLNKGVGVLLEGGVPYLISNVSAPTLYKLAHHAQLIIAHVVLLQSLQRRFGRLLPDVEFVVATADDPGPILKDVQQRGPHPPPPMFRFCKSQHHADILIPDIHFHMKRYEAELLSQVPAIDRQYPWQKRKAVLFGRFSPYKRMFHKGLEDLRKHGAAWQDSICVQAARSVFFCPVRTHFFEVAQRVSNSTPIPMDVGQQPKLPMQRHAEFKYLLHLDGQTCSSRLEQLMILGSLIVKEESGYFAFFHRLLKPQEHYVPFWKQRPEEVLDALQWAKDNDDRARQIGAAAQALAQKYFTKEALACYWFTLLKRYAALLRYRPGTAAGRRYAFHTPAADWLASPEGAALYVQRYNKTLQGFQ